MYGLAVIEVMLMSGYLSHIDEITGLMAENSKFYTNLTLQAVHT
jgi:hypothetical protein